MRRRNGSYIRYRAKPSSWKVVSRTLEVGRQGERSDVSDERKQTANCVISSARFVETVSRERPAAR